MMPMCEEWQRKPRNGRRLVHHLPLVLQVYVFRLTCCILHPKLQRYSNNLKRDDRKSLIFTVIGLFSFAYSKSLLTFTVWYFNDTENFQNICSDFDACGLSEDGQGFSPQTSASSLECWNLLLYVFQLANKLKCLFYYGHVIVLCFWGFFEMCKEIVGKIKLYITWRQKGHWLLLPSIAAYKERAVGRAELHVSVDTHSVAQDWACMIDPITRGLLWGYLTRGS